ncbi:MAG TPA: SusC/RagA family TonB-linked outer membrane protein [Gemmatimonadaceae bacterium]|nr:SusC/RagA family TonB-linked outer membrane protein [Gemmatimonadaceae bacterium]
MSARSVLRAVILTASLGSLAAAIAGAQEQQASITGRVTDRATGEGIAAAQVSIVGTAIGASTNSEGRYTIRSVRPGTVELRVLRVGYAEQKQTVTVAAGQAATADFAIGAVAISLAPVVTTATGEQRRVEVGNAIANVDVDSIVQNSAVTNIGDVLNSKVAGVTVNGGMQTGAGIRIRIRGTSSLSLTNNPIYIIDGIRVQGATGSSSLSVGGTTASRVGDLNPEEFESIEIVRGPSAATLYGTDAANGVVVITTKKGIAGRPQWTYYTEQTAITDRNDYPTAYRAWRTGTTTATNSTPANTVQCFLSQVVSAACTQDSVTSFNLHDDEETTPYGVGYRQQHGLQLRGGSETVRYFVHGEWEDEDGVTKVPEFEERYLASRGLSLRPEMRNPNHLRRITARTNVSFAPRDNLDLAVHAGYITQDLRLPRSDDSGTAGIAANTFGGPGFKYNRNAAGDTLYGWREFTPKDVYETVTTQAIERLISSVSSNWRPMDWLAFRGNFGVDYIQRHETQLCRFGDCALTNDRLGFKTDNRTNFFVYTVDAGGTATRQLSDLLQSQTTVGIQATRDILNRNGAEGVGLPPGATTVTAGAEKEADETTTESRTFGAYIEQRLAFRDRLFVTGAIRSDKNSAFGADFGTVFYPKFSLSWVMSEESFFPAGGLVDQLRFRTAYGASGVQPGTTDAVPYYSAVQTIGESGEVSGAVFTALGNTGLKPERSTEVEVGLDGTFWNSRLTAEITYYNKVSKDALVERVLPPSIGTGDTERFENLGEVRNRGWEALLDARILDLPSFGWNLTLTGTTNDNKLVSLGGLPPIIVSSTLRNVEGYPLNGWWSRRLRSYNDANGDGIISVTEIDVSPDVEFHGHSAPRREAAMTNTFNFLQGRLRLAAMMDYRGGHLVYNNTERIRCASRFNCQALVDRNASLFEQARTVMVREHASRSVAGFFEKGDFIRLRELALTFSPSNDLAARLFRGRSISATLAARNLGLLWTEYSGVDPESFGTTGDAPSSFQAFGSPTYLTFRLTLGF